MVRRARGWAAVLGLVGATAGGSVLIASNEACTFLFDTAAEQCTTDQECQGKGPDFANTVCGDDHTCTVNPTKSCNSNKQCAATFKDGPYFCRQSDHQCKPLTSIDCPQVLAQPGDLEDDNTVFLGFMAPLSLGDKATGIAMKNAADMARNDFKELLGGLPPAKAGGKPRPLAIVVCDELRDSAKIAYVDAAKHLVNTVQVPAIIGPWSSGNTIRVMTDVTLASKTLVMSHGNTGAQFTTLAKPCAPCNPPDQPSLYYRATPSGDYVAKVFADKMVKPIEDSVKGGAPDGRVPAGQKMKLMVMNKGDAFGKGYAAGVNKYIKYNGGLSAADNGDAYFKAADYGFFVDAKAADAQAAFAAAADIAVQFQPHVIVITGTAEALNIVSIVEDQWKNTAYRPLWIHLGGTLRVPAMLDLVGASTKGLVERTTGILYDPGPGNATNQNFQGRYKASYPGSDTNVVGQLTAFAYASYDVTYSYALAIASLGEQPITGENMSRAFAKLLPAPPGAGAKPLVPYIPGNISQLVAGVQGGGIDVTGASGPLNLDLKTGDTETDVQMWCVTRDETTQKANGFQNNGSYWNVENQVIDCKGVCGPADQPDVGVYRPFSCYPKSIKTTPVGDGGAP